MPDVVVHKMGNDYTVILNEDGIPRLRVNSLYRSLLRNQGDRGKVEALFAKLPGAAELAAREGGDGAAKGGLLGLLGGGLMGGPLAAISKLSAAGLSTDQIKQVGTLTLAHAKAKAGPDLVREVAGSIPGLSGFV